MKHRLLLPALTAAILLLAAPSAFGAVYCVGQVPQCGGTHEPDLQTALDDAKNINGGADYVLIGPGTYTAPTGFDYTDVNNANTVDIEGVLGLPLPTITLTGTASQQHALTLHQQGSTVSGVTLDVPDTPTFSLFGLDLQGATARYITVNTPSSSATLNTGVQMSNAMLQSSHINGGLDFSIGVDARTNSVVKDNIIFGTRGVETFGDNIQITGNAISSSFKGLSIQGGAPIYIDNDLVDMRGGTGATSYGLFVGANPSFPTGTVNASQLTIRNGDSHTVGVEEQTGNSGSNITVNLTDSIIRDVGNASELGTVPLSSSFTLNADHDDYDQSSDLPAVLTAGQTRSETNILPNVDPLFVAPVFGADGISGSYRLAYNSPVIDQGDSAPLGMGELDQAEHDRIVDGAAPFTGPVRDLGAYEYQHLHPIATTGAHPVTVAPGQAVTIDASGSGDPDPGDSITYLWTFDDGATATGRTATHAFTTVGTHTATLTVTDPTGLTGTASTHFSVVAPPSTQPPALVTSGKKCKKHKKKAAAARKCKKRKVQ
jgi:PKD domain